MTRVIGYIRRSADRQGESIDPQRAKLQAYAAVQGWTLTAVYADDAISGSEMNRPGLERLMSDATASGDVDVVLAGDRTRLARPKDPIDAMMLERRLVEAGKRVIYAATGQEADRTFAGGLLGYVEHYQNGDYLSELSRDTMRGLVERAKRGLWPGGPIPFGYDRLILDGDTPKRIVRDMDDGEQLVMNAADGQGLKRLPKGKRYGKQDHETVTLIPSHPARVGLVQRLFVDYAAGRPTRLIGDEDNAAGFRTARGGVSTVQTLLPMLEHPAYAGRCVYNRRTRSKWHRYRNGNSVKRQDEAMEARPSDDWVTCEDAWAALLDVATSNQVQERRRVALRKPMLAAMVGAGVQAWPRMFQNLRSSRQMELERTFPGHVVCAWMSNTRRVAERHYLQVTEDDFEAASVVALCGALRNGAELGGVEAEKMDFEGVEGSCGGG